MFLKGKKHLQDNKETWVKLIFYIRAPPLWTLQWRHQSSWLCHLLKILSLNINTVVIKFHHEFRGDIQVTAFSQNTHYRIPDLLGTPVLMPALCSSYWEHAVRSMSSMKHSSSISKHTARRSERLMPTTRTCAFIRFPKTFTGRVYMKRWSSKAKTQPPFTPASPLWFVPSLGVYQCWSKPTLCSQMSRNIAIIWDNGIIIPFQKHSEQGAFLKLGNSVRVCPIWMTQETVGKHGITVWATSLNWICVSFDFFLLLETRPLRPFPFKSWKLRWVRSCLKALLLLHQASPYLFQKKALAPTYVPWCSFSPQNEHLFFPLSLFFFIADLHKIDY